MTALSTNIINRRALDAIIEQLIDLLETADAIAAVEAGVYSEPA